jgi:hypothetical protein
LICTTACKLCSGQLTAYQAYTKTPHFGAFFILAACIAVPAFYHITVQTRLFTQTFFSKTVKTQSMHHGLIIAWIKAQHQ